VIQGILSFKFQVFGYFDLPLIFSVYYGFTLGNPIASIVIGSSLGLMQDSLSAQYLGQWPQQNPDRFFCSDGRSEVCEWISP
jgi:hypothetical protein